MAKTKIRSGVSAVPATAGVVIWLWAGAAATPQVSPGRLVSDRVNGEHRDLAARIAPVQIGPFTVQLSSPSHTIEVLEHELRLAPLGAGDDSATLWARYRGQADLVAELSVAGVASQLEDRIEIPLQETELSGRIQLERNGEGYRITTVETPAEVEIEVRSGLGSQLKLLCGGFAILALGSVDCESLGQAFSRLRLPLPEAGRSYSVAASQLTRFERSQLEAYLALRSDSIGAKP